MSTVTAGQSATVTIPAGSAWQISTTGEADVRLIAGAPDAGYRSWRVTPGRPLQLPPFSSTGIIQINGVSGTTSDGAREADTLSTSEVALARALVSGAGIPGTAHPRYFCHLFAGAQLPDDSMVYDISGAGSHAQRETDLTVSALWTTAAGYASTLDTAAVDGQRLRRLKLPALNWDWLGGESLLIWWLGKCTAEGASTNLMGNCRGVSGENGFRVRVASTGALGLTMSEGATATTTFTTSTLVPFDGGLHSIGFWFDGRERKGYSYVDEAVQVNGNTPTGDMLPTAAQVAAGTDRLILGGDSLLTGSATSSIAQSTRALAILKFASTDTLPSAEQVRQAMMQLRAAPNRLILRGAL